MAVPLCKVSTKAATTNVNDNDSRTQLLELLLVVVVALVCAAAVATLQLHLFCLPLCLPLCLSVFVSVCIPRLAVCLSWQTFVLTGEKGYAGICIKIHAETPRH